MSSYSALVSGHASLVLYWRLGEGSGFPQDSGPNGLHCDDARGVTYGVAGAIANDADTAITTDGTTNVVSTPDNNLLDLADGPLSYEFWVKRSATQGVVQALIAKGATTAHVRFEGNNKLSFLKQGTAGAFASNTSAITDQNWHHIVVTKNGAASKVYQDGVDVTVAGTNQTCGNSAAIFSIGSAVTANRFPGSLDEVAVYSAVLSADEVRQHYDTGKGERVEADSVTATDATVAEAGPAKADSVSASDQVSVEPGLAEADSVSVSDAQSLEAGPGVADSVTATDALVAEGQAVTSDTATATDAVAVEVESTRADSVTASDFLGAELFTEQVAADTVTVTDAQALEVEVAVDDSVTATDAVVSVPPPGAVTDTGGGWAMPPKLPLRLAHELVLADVVLASDDFETSLRPPPPQHHGQRLADRVVVRDEFEAEAELDPRLRDEELEVLLFA